MSYGLHAYAVSLNQLALVLGAQPKPAGFISRLFGSSRGDVVAEVLRHQGPLDDDDGFDDEDSLTVEQALRDLCSGAELNAQHGDAYAYAFLALCDQYGEFLDNSEWSQMRAAWGERVNDAMREAGIAPETLSVYKHIMYRGAPIDIPAPFDFPYMGYLRNAEVEPAIQALAGETLAEINDDTRSAVAQIGSWLDRANVLNVDLVFFYY